MPFYLPGSIPTHIEPDIIDKISFPPGWSLDNMTTQPGGQKIAGAMMAFYDYTFGGAVEVMAAKSITQGTIGFVIGGAGVYSTLGGAIAFELAMDFAILGVVATILDPSHKWSGGLDEPRFHQHEHTQPKSFQDVYRPSYYGKDAQGAWG